MSNVITRGLLKNSTIDSVNDDHYASADPPCFGHRKEEFFKINPHLIAQKEGSNSTPDLFML